MIADLEGTKRKGHFDKPPLSAHDSVLCYSAPKGPPRHLSRETDILGSREAMDHRVLAPLERLSPTPLCGLVHVAQALAPLTAKRALRDQRLQTVCWPYLGSRTERKVVFQCRTTRGPHSPFDWPSGTWRERLEKALELLRTEGPLTQSRK